jgi:RimJ/RimL family protein N-acetyltransferase
LEINDHFHLSPPDEKDIPRYVEFLNDMDIYNHTLTIAHPYTENDARFFINMCRGKEKEYGQVLQFAIRNKNEEIIGGIGFHGKNLFDAVKHKDEIGYWLAAPFRRQGIMSSVIPVILDYGRNVRGLSRFEAPVYEGNIASEKTLLKCGFVREGIMKNAYQKNGVFIDGIMLAKVF